VGGSPHIFSAGFGSTDRERVALRRATSNSLREARVLGHEGWTEVREGGDRFEGPSGDAWASGLHRPGIGGRASNTNGGCSSFPAHVNAVLGDAGNAAQV
jgi:hypothetical protein